MGEEYIRSIPSPALTGNHLTALQQTVNELRETSGNTETATGTVSGGVTAAAAISALQDAAGKTSRDAVSAGYRAYGKIINMVIELIRQFYDAPRTFRIAGEEGAYAFISFTNAGMKPSQNSAGVAPDTGCRTPVYDIDVEPERKSGYTRLAQNELALQLYSAGLFNPALASQSLQTIDMMEFDGKEKVRSGIVKNGLENIPA